MMGDMTAFRVHAEKLLAKVRQMQGPQAGLNGVFTIDRMCSL